MLASFVVLENSVRFNRSVVLGVADVNIIMSYEKRISMTIIPAGFEDQNLHSSIKRYTPAYCFPLLLCYFPQVM